MRRLLLSLAMMLLSAAALAVGVDREQFEDPAMEARARDLMAQIRCVVCQSQSIEDSNARLAEEMRGLVREKLAAGESEADIKRYLVSRYGDSILLKPRMTPRTFLLWAAPFLFLAVGVFALIRLRRPAAGPSLSAEEEARADKLLREAERKS